jgi:hypothetical protein
MARIIRNRNADTFGLIVDETELQILHAAMQTHPLEDLGGIIKVKSQALAMVIDEAITAAVTSRPYPRDT